MRERPPPSSATASARLRRQKQSSTRPEVAVRRSLHALGLRYRVSFAVHGISCDIVFPTRHLIVFVDGCFWHGCPEHGTTPKSNTSWWTAKIAANQERDRRQTARLQGLGWTVLRCWEHECPAEVAIRVWRTLR